MTETAVLMLGMPYAMLYIFSALAVVLIATLTVSAILLGLGCFLMKRLILWLQKRKVLREANALLANGSPDWASPNVVCSYCGVRHQWESRERSEGW